MLLDAADTGAPRMTLDIAKLRAKTLALIHGTTPGPWFRDCWDVLGSGAGAGTGSICEVAYPNGDDDQYWKHGEADANVRLIAAAPTLAADNLRLLDEIERLREALADLVECNDRWNASVQAVIGRVPNWTDGYLDAARAALAEGSVR